MFSYKVSQNTLIQSVDFQQDQLSLSHTFTAEACADYREHQQQSSGQLRELGEGTMRDSVKEEA